MVSYAPDFMRGNFGQVPDIGRNQMGGGQVGGGNYMNMLNDLLRGGGMGNMGMYGGMGGQYGGMGGGGFPGVGRFGGSFFPGMLGGMFPGQQGGMQFPGQGLPPWLGNRMQNPATMREAAAAPALPNWGPAGAPGPMLRPPY